MVINLQIMAVRIHLYKWGSYGRYFNIQQDCTVLLIQSIQVLRIKTMKFTCTWINPWQALKQVVSLALGQSVVSCLHVKSICSAETFTKGLYYVMYLGTQESYRKTKAILVKPILLLKFHISYNVKHFTNHEQLVDCVHCTPIFAIFMDNKNFEYNDWCTMNTIYRLPCQTPNRELHSCKNFVILLKHAMLPAPCMYMLYLPVHKLPHSA